MEPIALQLYTVRDLMGKDVAGTLRKVSEVGYCAVQVAGMTTGADELAPLLQRYNLAAVAAHVNLDLLRGDARPHFRELKSLGCDYAVLAWVPPEERGSIERAKALAETLNRAGTAAQGEGLHLGYHNHDFEFAPIGATTMYQILSEETDSDLVFFEPDVYWIQYAGHKPADIIRSHHNRVPLLHTKDMADNRERSFAPVGTGILDWSAILAAAKAAGTQWYIVEQDTSSDPIRDIETSLHNLRELLSETDSV